MKFLVIFYLKTIMNNIHTILRVLYNVLSIVFIIQNFPHTLTNSVMLPYGFNRDQKTLNGLYSPLCYGILALS